jgi:hypothetical protein
LSIAIIKNKRDYFMKFVPEEVKSVGVRNGNRDG